MADSKIKTAVAPEPETKSHPLLLSFGTGDVKTPLYVWVITPIQFGPIRHAPCFTDQVSNFFFKLSALLT